MIPKQQFDKDEKVLCFHGELLYEAKILEVEREHSTAPFRYRVHYKGWKNTWDDWVENDRLRKLNDENREIAQALKRQYLESTQKSTKPTVSKRKGLPSDLGSTRGSEERHASAPATGRGQKRGRNPDLEEKGRRAMWDDRHLDDSYEATRRVLERVEKEQRKRHEKEVADIVATSMVNVKELNDVPHPLERQTLPPFYPLRHRIWRDAIEISKESNVDVSNKQEETFNNRPMIKIPIPDYIKSLLVDDWEEVTKNLALVPLPAQKPVNMILRDYVEEEKPKRFPGSADMDLLEEVVAGMKEYFDVALGRMLLYRFERQQYLDVRKSWGEQKGEWKDKTGPADTYGAEHLCRMIVNMPEIIAQTNMDGQSVNRLREEMTKFLHWLNKNTKTYFLAKYETADQDYIEKSRAS
ncbi:MAG: hypothetical protein Q9208_005662 [Pyrenodesmia sp. 3 TL-2023]